MVEFEKPKIECQEMTDYYGMFVVEPLERGFGQTLGNSLRRTLLSSLPGYAVTSVKIDGVLHEMSTVEGVKEDVTEIILKIKQLRLQVFNYDERTEKHIYISAIGPCVVTGADVHVDSDVEIINSDLHIATLDEGARLEIDMVVGRGRGYVSAAKNKNDRMPIGQIAIDSIYSPIRKVNFKVENTRVGQSIDYDRLTMEVWTTGCTKPDEAVSIAAKLLCEHLSQFENLTEHVQGNDVGFADPQEGETSSLTDMTIEELDLSVRSYNCLKRAGINTVGELIEHDEEAMLRVRNLGRKSLEEVLKKLADLGLKLRSSDD